jgi:hypothetical protein
MIDAQIIAAAVTVAGTVVAGFSAAIRTVYKRSTSRTDALAERVDVVTDRLVECHEQHAAASERIGKLEGWRDGWDAHKAHAKTTSETDTA